jgi:hypothetical protein
MAKTKPVETWVESARRRLAVKGLVLESGDRCYYGPGYVVRNAQGDAVFGMQPPPLLSHARARRKFPSRTGTLEPQRQAVEHSYRDQQWHNDDQECLRSIHHGSLGPAASVF